MIKKEKIMPIASDEELRKASKEFVFRVRYGYPQHVQAVIHARLIESNENSIFPWQERLGKNCLYRIDEWSKDDWRCFIHSYLDFLASKNALKASVLHL